MLLNSIILWAINVETIDNDRFRKYVFASNCARQSVLLSLSLGSEQSLYADLLNAKVNREQGVQGISAAEVLTKMDRVIDGVESSG